MKIIKILFIITGLNQGGAEAMLFKLLNGLNKSKFECLVISMSDMGVYGEKIASLGIPVFCLKMNSVRFSFISFCSFLKIIYHYKPDIIQGWMYHANLFSLFSKILSPKSSIIFNIRQSLHGNIDKFSTRIVIKLNAWASYSVRAVVNNSIVSQAQHRNIGFSNHNEVYISNGFHANFFKPSVEIYKNFRCVHGLDVDTKIVGNLARYHPIKNHIGQLILFHKIKMYYPYKIKLVLCGKDVEYKNIQLIEEINSLGLQNDCILLGPVKSYEIMPAFDVYSSSSWGEAFPNVIGEAMLCGVPCVATDVGDCKQIMGGLGAVAAPGDYDLLAKHCLEKLKISDEERSRIRQHVIDNYSIEKIVDQYQNLYADILNREN